ncbi:hypothetical protein NC796_00150 [Aliifodinibius sp. S!AR15-10]|uniref:hypothetical protein n=1 Tax=Aliifodinibius sp. S!AR15-10 TaxID=2950437 RepID=UPI00285D63EA|nr:hypothetical protein [Aliifodinibius sp. S!AR15-10]MDR8389524.1 hypothetical protein [Aliifodinibius sp. S!AR15-10]
MFLDLIDFPIESKRLDWQARHVLRNVNQEPSLLVRIKITGTSFPHRAEDPFVQVGELRSRFVEIAEDGLSVNSYFDEPLPQRGRIEFGYGEQVLLRLPRRFDLEMLDQLDPQRLPKNTRFIDRFFGDGPIE